jgi:hypothetical protein
MEDFLCFVMECWVEEQLRWQSRIQIVFDKYSSAGCVSRGLGEGRHHGCRTLFGCVGVGGGRHRGCLWLHEGTAGWVGAERQVGWVQSARECGAWLRLLLTSLPRPASLVRGAP